MNFDDFKFNVGNIVMFCQIIEHDIKVIYASMLKGDYNKNYQELIDSNMTLGQTITNLQELDFSDSNHFFAKSDYVYLKQVSRKRNYWCHQAYLNFVYIENFEYSKEYKVECLKLQNDCDKLNDVFMQVQKIKKDALKKYGRI